MEEFKKGKFPEDIKELIQKCENLALQIQTAFLNKNCILIKDLYLENKGHKQKDFLNKLGIECNAFLKTKNINKNEVKGLYIFGDLNTENIFEPIYIGISRTVFRRLYQHTWGKKHNEASLAYLMAKTRLQYIENRNTLSVSELEQEQSKIKNFRVIVIPEENDYDLYFMEVYLAGKLKTKWNSFRTH
ncbi:hypothetical protein [Flavobacterium soyae]|uniref:hypothetical protein n=1 Tax=Flavobacterium soyae TaxID=2903098 RepID=UPI001E4C110A|nr:hypothetical protein [Flavobacterium soyae]MCD9576338.1 hypothetical protein [Flavobacterium soyae]